VIATRTLLVLSTLLLGGCLREDLIAISNDGAVSFESIVTEPDEEKRLEPAVFEKAVANLLTELQQHKWKVQQTWTSKTRPYQVKVTGSGKLSEVVGATAFYNLRRLSGTTYQVTLLPPAGGGSARVAFKPAKDSAVISDAAGKPISDIDNVTAAETYTIVLK
jgi:hypothetical protein